MYLPGPTTDSSGYMSDGATILRIGSKPEEGRPYDQGRGQGTPTVPGFAKDDGCKWLRNLFSETDLVSTITEITAIPIPVRAG